MTHTPSIPAADVGLDDATQAELLAVINRNHGPHISPRRYTKAVRDELARMEAERPARLTELQRMTEEVVHHQLRMERLREWLERRFGGGE